MVGDRAKPPTEFLSTRYKAMGQRELVELGWKEEDFTREQSGRRNRGRIFGTNHGASTVEQLFDFLKGAGLNQVDCLWKQGTEAVICGEKESAQRRMAP